MLDTPHSLADRPKHGSAQRRVARSAPPQRLLIDETTSGKPGFQTVAERVADIIFVQAYLTARRMRVAADLLSGSRKRLSVIANEVGYESEISFNRAFRRWAGLPPGRYRRRTHEAAARRTLADAHAAELTGIS